MQQAALDIVASWPVDAAAAGWRTNAGDGAKSGPVSRVFELASVTKILAAYGALVAIEERTISLDTPLGPPGSTVRHILAHASGLGFEQSEPARGPCQRRIYSNTGYELLGDLIAEASEIDFHTYVTEAIFEPLRMSNTDFYGSPAFGARSTVDDLLLFVDELLNPTLISIETLDLAVTPHFVELEGILPGYGQQSPNTWGLGFEIRANKSPHWSSPNNSVATFGHFGRSGSLLWVDPIKRIGFVALANQDFGPWAKKAWPVVSERVLTEAAENSSV